MAPKELKDIHPLGKSPTIEVLAPGAEKPVIIAESGAIVEYLCEHFGRSLIPQRYPEGKDGVIGAETEEWLRYRVSYFLFCHLQRRTIHCIEVYQSSCVASSSRQSNRLAGGSSFVDSFTLVELIPYLGCYLFRSLIKS
jgi:hypothetical protein